MCSRFILAGKSAQEEMSVNIISSFVAWIATGTCTVGRGRRWLLHLALIKTSVAVRKCFQTKIGLNNPRWKPTEEDR